MIWQTTCSVPGNRRLPWQRNGSATAVAAGRWQLNFARCLLTRVAREHSLHTYHNNALSEETNSWSSAVKWTQCMMFDQIQMKTAPIYCATPDRVLLYCKQYMVTQPNKKRRSSAVSRPSASASLPTVPSKINCFFSCGPGCHAHVLLWRLHAGRLLKVEVCCLNSKVEPCLGSTSCRREDISITYGVVRTPAASRCAPLWCHQSQTAPRGSACTGPACGCGPAPAPAVA